MKLRDLFLSDKKIEIVKSNKFGFPIYRIVCNTKDSITENPKNFFSNLLNKIIMLTKNPLLIFFPIIKKKYSYYYNYRLISDKSLAIKFKEFYLAKIYKYMKKDMLILDYGCGQGRIIGLLNQLGYNNIVGQDINYFSEWENYKATFLINPLKCKNKYPYRYNSFDIIFSIQVTMYLNNVELEEHIKNFSFLLKKGGYLLLEDRNSNGLNTQILKKNNSCPYVHNKSDIISLLEKYNFEILEIKTFGIITKIFPNFFSFLLTLLMPKKTFDVFEFYDRFWLDKLLKLFIPKGKEKLILFICRKK